ncbi:probable E3 ubiquitin-protein ligase HERC4 isoform X1 [Penaeus chinensis]|uniref:probable E3 ubiquitin-protein ligase HERC4 isoform X1 n=2 Tax=Penaeus chinensis TaxID=139456 RepID=UPI001FB7A57F|nr:probable E3 ubiquitin-protein ligase HERC4 isoform X1 [Penaeus chinensis]XP_047486163.1 probable E3 ubiquitin-protein ligase HERC4 isoform X1 [Penaeus chinensis]
MCTSIQPMYCWGSTVNGELGVGAPEVEQLTLPTVMDFAESWNVRQVASGLTHCLILTEEGSVYSCGNNELGQLGHNKITRKPELVDNLENYSIVQVAAGDQHSIALTSWGLIYAWGENGFGQLGLNSTEPHTSVPKLVKSLARKQVIQVACGSSHTLALTSGGELYAWGSNLSGQLGLGHREGPQKDPILIKALLGVPLVHITAGGQHSAALTQAGFLLTWGSNKYGQLGFSANKDDLYCNVPTPVPNLATYSEPLRYVSVGEGHTAVLDAHGKLFTFGYGRYGQLGHGNCDDLSVPRTVLDLCGSKVSQVACGRCHTLVYIPSQGQLYAFGQGMSGQLGIKTPQNRNLPQVVVGPWLSPRGVSLLDTSEEEESPRIYVKRIYSGGDASMVTVTREAGSADDFCKMPLFQVPLQIEENNINKMVSTGEEDMVDDDLFSYMETALGSVACWNISFLKEGSAKHSHGLDFRKAEDCLAKLGRVTRESFIEIIQTSLESVVKELPLKPITLDGLRCFMLLPLLQNFNDARHMRSVHLPYAEAVLGLDKAKAVVFKKWLKDLPNDFMSRLLSIYKGVVVQILKDANANSSEIERRVLQASLRFLALLHEENHKDLAKSTRLPYEEFYIPEIAEKIDIRNDYLNWIRSKTLANVKIDGPISFCEYPFLFDAQAKTLLLRCDATRQMQGAIQEAVYNSNPMIWLINPSEVQFLNIHIHRDNIVQDTITQLMDHRVTDYKRPLKVRFIGEEAEDAGGVRKEFFLLLLREILKPDYGMFTHHSETNLIWFKEGSLEPAATYALIGIVCGLAIYNFTIINLPFPLALYKKLLGESVGLDNLADLEPSLTRSLHELLEYEGSDVEDVYGLNFTVTQDFFGETKSIPLKPDGENIPVTSQNKQEYVDLLVDYKLNKSIESQYKAFHDGFYRVCGGIVLKLFQPMELMALVTGNENYDWTELERSAEYKGEYYPDHHVIKMFWEVFHELTVDQKKQFLIFLTGTDRIPILGMKSLKVIIQSTADDSYLPVAHTCIAQLDLPVYNTKEKLRYKLLQAIQQSEGFGLV